MNKIIDKVVNMYVQRIDYSSPYDFLKSEILEGRLRQGWGPEGADLNGGVDKFCEAGRNAGWEDSDSRLSRKYNNLYIMLEMKPGDIIIVPKLNMYTPLGDWETDGGAWAKTFTLLEVTEGYRFEAVPVPAWDGFKEFGHIIDVKIIGSYSYYQNDLTGLISEMIKQPYHWNSESRVTSEVIIGAVKELIARKDGTSDVQEDSAGEDVLSLVESAVENCSSEQFSKLVTQLFVDGGFAVKDSGSLTFGLLPSCNLIGDIALSVCEKFSAVRVCTSESEWQNDAVNILIDIAGTFSDSALRAARERGITLLRFSAREFAELLLKYRVILPE